ncbi:YhfC family glutamic-type intramembrane protease [Cohnella yongneupensis]|uniref:YhfC family glutamic-type intramembrane protease n=1 Tax=Cohnella yongneupensis TaxID=425006 RepID=A0ABW0QWH2_9BACL
MNPITTEPIIVNEEVMAKASVRSLLCLPLYLAVPALFWYGFKLAGYEMDWQAFGLGALGWFIALLLRGPLSAVVMKLPRDQAANIIGLSSGVLEEGTRVILLALTSVASSWALSVGQGWAAIEVLYVMINIVAIASLVKRTDEKATQAKQMLDAQGLVQTSPFWGILERIWASAFHIGCTLIVARYPWTVVALIPLHSGLNWFAVRLVKDSVGKSSILIALFGISVLTVGLVIHS